MKYKVLLNVLFLLGSSVVVFSQKANVSSPNQKINIELYNQQGQDIGSWYLKVNYSNNGISKYFPEKHMLMQYYCLFSALFQCAVLQRACFQRAYNSPSRS